MTKLFEVPHRTEISYRQKLYKLLNPEIPTGLTYKNIDEWLDRLALISSKDDFIDSADSVARSMIIDVNLWNTYSWRELSHKSHVGAIIRRSLHETKRGAIGEAIRSELEETTGIISSVPEKISNRLKKEIEYAREQGATEQGCLNIIRARFSSLIHSRIQLIARTDPQRVASSFTKARSDDLKLNCFIWTTVGDTSVRHSHEKMNDVVVFWNDLPSPEALIEMPGGLGHYAPGGCPNCRCIAWPVLSIIDLFHDKTRVKVYTDESIRRLTQQQFLELVA